MRVLLSNTEMNLKLWKTSNGNILLALSALTALNIQGSFKGWVSLNQTGRDAYILKEQQKADLLTLTN